MCDREQHVLQRWGLYEPSNHPEIRTYVSGLNRALWLPGFSSKRHAGPTHPQVSQVGDLLVCRGLGTMFDAVSKLPAMLRRRSAEGMKPQDGSDHGRVPDCVGPLRIVNFVETRNRLECDCDRNRFFERRGVRSLRQ